jgi:hypothetical protein
MSDARANWPALPLDDWRDTYGTLHMGRAGRWSAAPRVLRNPTPGAPAPSGGTGPDSAGSPAMPIAARESLAGYLLARAHQCAGWPLAGALPATEHVRALEVLAAFVLAVPETDERLLTLGALAVRDGRFVPGGATRHALGRLRLGSGAACDRFLSDFVRIARDDALVRAKAAGVLPWLSRR